MINKPAQPKAKKNPHQPQAKPYLPCGYTKSDVYAIKALQLGTATPDQQKMALHWIINVCADTYGMSFRPGGVEGQRETDFAEGKRFVGNQIVKLVNYDVSLLKQE